MDEGARVSPSRLGLAQLRGRVFQTMGEDPHDLHPHLGKIGDHAEEQILCNPEGRKLAGRLDRRGARHVAEDGDLADDVVFSHLGDRQRSRGGVHKDVGFALDNDIGRVAFVAVAEQRLARLKGNALAGECHELQFYGFDIREQWNLPQNLDFLIDAHCSDLPVR
jgi:hypothetical protein